MYRIYADQKLCLSQAVPYVFYIIYCVPGLNGIKPGLPFFLAYVLHIHKYAVNACIFSDTGNFRLICYIH